MVYQQQPSPWPIKAYCQSNVGRVRQNNEDRGLIDLGRSLFIVSDGMGGHQAGEIASEAVVTILPRMIDKLTSRVQTPSKEVMEGVLRDAIVELSQRLREESQGLAGLQGMGATVAVVWLRGAWAHVAYMGDSRIYLYRNGDLIPLTDDHSVIGLLLRHGEISPEEAKEHPARGRLSRYVGMEGNASSDEHTITLQLKDRLLLCSDGLTGMLTDEHIKHLLGENPEAEAACQALISAANAAGGKDNVTALVLNCG